MIFRCADLYFRHVLPSDGLFVADCFVDWPTGHTMQCLLNDTAEWAAASMQAKRPFRPDGTQQETFIVCRGSEPVGVVRYEQVANKTCKVTHHLVHPNHRRQGLHSQIVPAAFAYAFDVLHSPICRYEVLKQAIGVFKVGEKLGYTAESERKTDLGNEVVEMWFSAAQWQDSPMKVQVQML